jgi:CheY-like chemotaxis protein
MSKPGCSVLVQDDNPADLYIIEQALHESGVCCQVTLCTCPAEAVAHLRGQSFDLLLTDFSSNTGDIAEFIRSVRNSNHFLPIVVLSGSQRSSLAYQAGASAFIRKPLTLQEFLSKIARVMHFYTQIAELPSDPITQARATVSGTNLYS